jgi:hypothetical protein
LFLATQIFSFTFKCASCDNEIIIKTDPQNNTYDYAQGIRAMEQDFTPELGDSIIEAVSDETRNKLQSDPMFQLQHEKEDKEKSRTAKDRLTSLMDLSVATTREDYDINSLLRRKNRSDRKRSRELLEEGRSRGLSIPLVEANDTDTAAAKEAMQGRKHRTAGSSSFKVSERVRRTSIISESIFAKSKPKSKEPLSSSSSRPPSASSEKGSQHPVSSAARAHLVHVKAMQKAAERNIRVKGLKLPPPAEEGRHGAKKTESAIHRGEARSNSTKEDAKTATKNICVKVVPAVNALDMIAGYTDDDISY